MAKKPDPSRGGPLQLPFFMPEVSWDPPRIGDLPSWKEAKRVGLDCETRDPDIRELGSGVYRDGHTVGWSFAIEGGPSFYLPTRHEGGDNLDPSAVHGYLRDQLRDFEGEIVGANIKYDLEYALKDGLRVNSGARIRDVQVADPLIDELQFSYSLKSIGERLGVQSKDESTLLDAARAMGVDPKGGLWRLPARYVARYAAFDAESVLAVYALQRKKLDDQSLWRVFDLESELIPVLVRMRQRGIRIDFDRLEQIEKWSLEQEAEALAAVRHHTGVRITVGEVWKPDLLAQALQYMGHSIGRTSTGAPNIDAAFLDGLDCPVAAAIRRARKVNRIRTNYAASLRKYAVGDRIHCTFNQIAGENEKGEQKGVRYGRMSISDPPLQQQPSKDKDPEIAGEWRKAFAAEPDCEWAAPDYSQQEPRWVTHYAAHLGLPKAGEAAALYREDPSTDNHSMMTRMIHGDQVDIMEQQLYKTARTGAKIVFLGLCYGEGGAKLCRDLRLPTRWMLRHSGGITYYDTREQAWMARSEAGAGYVVEVAGAEGQRILDNFDDKVPYVRQLARRAEDQAQSVGFVRTFGGRRLHFARKPDGGYDWTHKALNRVIQGSSADQAKAAMIELDKAGYFLQLQMHDEMGISVAQPEIEMPRIVEIMEHAHERFGPALVPFKVDGEWGPSWGEVK